MDLSIVIPVRDEAENIAPLVAEITTALDGLTAYEIVYVDDGSSDGTAAEIMRLALGTPHLRLLRHARSCGQSAAVLTGVKAARGIWIATLDGDGQNDPADIPRLWRLAGTSPSSPPLLVAGYRQKRQDSWSKRAWPRAFFAKTGCGAAARRRHPGYGVRVEALSARSLSRSAGV